MTGLVHGYRVTHECTVTVKFKRLSGNIRKLEVCNHVTFWRKI